MAETHKDVEEACRVMHDAYEAAAAQEGWETQERSRKPWEDVPEANKATMRAAVTALLKYLDVEPDAEPEPETYEGMVARLLEQHQVEFISHEVGYACGCDEDGVLGAMPFLADALGHQAEMVMEAVRENLRQQFARVTKWMVPAGFVGRDALAAFDGVPVMKVNEVVTVAMMINRPQP